MQDVLIGHWNKLRELTKERRCKLTVDDLNSMSCNYDFLVTLLQKKYGYAVFTPPKTKSTNDLPSSIENIGH